jgi:hypothetical protein
LAWIKSVRVRHSEDGKAGVKKETERSRTQLVDLTVFIESPPCLMLIVHWFSLWTHIGHLIGQCVMENHALTHEELKNMGLQGFAWVNLYLVVILLSPFTGLLMFLTS